MAEYVVLFAVYTLALARLTRLVTTDDITLGWRRKLIERYGEGAFINQALACPWCASIWLVIALGPVVLLAGYTHPVVLWLAIAGAGLYVVGLLFRLDLGR